MDKNNQKLKKRLIICMIAAVCVIPVLIVAIYALDVYMDKKDQAPEGPIDYDFYPIDFDENIYEDSEYIELTNKGYMSYTDSNVTLGIKRENAKDYGTDVEFIVEYIYSIIDGDTDSYNSFFSELYYEYADPHERFTMQKLYEIEFEKISVSEETEKGSSYKKYVYTLSYRIFENNGSFRNDIGDYARKQYITITDREGSLAIDAISGVVYKNK